MITFGNPSYPIWKAGFDSGVDESREAIAELVGALQTLHDSCDEYEMMDERNAARAAITKHQQPTTTEQAPALYLCTKCGGANYGCGCDSFKNCTVPLYTNQTEKE